MQEHEFIKSFHELCVAFGKEFDRETALVYFKYLGEFDKEALQKAVEDYVISGSAFFPRISELLEKMSPDSMGRSWNKIVSIAAGGCRRWKDLTDTEIAVINAIGGMARIQNATDQDLHFIFNDFQQAFPVQQKRQIKYDTDIQRLKDLNVVPETFQFLKTKLPSEKLLEAKMASQIGTKI